MQRRNPNVHVVRRGKGTVHKEHLFSTRRDFNKHYQGLQLGLSSRGEREQRFDHKVPGEYSYIFSHHSFICSVILSSNRKYLLSGLGIALIIQRKNFLSTDFSHCCTAKVQAPIKRQKTIKPESHPYYCNIETFVLTLKAWKTIQIILITLEIGSGRLYTAGLRTWQSAS